MIQVSILPHQYMASQPRRPQLKSISLFTKNLICSMIYLCFYTELRQFKDSGMYVYTIKLLKFYYHCRLLQVERCIDYLVVFILSRE
jgi:hypothetical protein